MQAVIRGIFAIQHRMNPLHVYCRFMDKGYARQTSFCCCRLYEIAVFSWVRRILSACLLLAFVSRTSRPEALRRARIGKGSGRPSPLSHGKGDVQ